MHTPWQWSKWPAVWHYTVSVLLETLNILYILAFLNKKLGEIVFLPKHLNFHIRTFSFTLITLCVCIRSGIELVYLYIYIKMCGPYGCEERLPRSALPSVLQRYISVAVVGCTPLMVLTTRNCSARLYIVYIFDCFAADRFSDNTDWCAYPALLELRKDCWFCSVPY